jgi:hypothetical protein
VASVGCQLGDGVEHVANEEIVVRMANRQRGRVVSVFRGLDLDRGFADGRRFSWFR